VLPRLQAGSWHLVMAARIPEVYHQLDGWVPQECLERRVGAHWIGLVEPTRALRIAICRSTKLELRGVHALGGIEIRQVAASDECCPQAQPPCSRQVRHQQCAIGGSPPGGNLPDWFSSDLIEERAHCRVARGSCQPRALSRSGQGGLSGRAKARTGLRMMPSRGCRLHRSVCCRLKVGPLRSGQPKRTVWKVQL
jgi:hypothetical protein